jgi:hypothetical protein
LTLSESTHICFLVSHHPDHSAHAAMLKQNIPGWQ